MKDLIYIKPALQKTIYKNVVLVRDVCEVSCKNKNLKEQILNIPLYEFRMQSGKNQDKKSKKVYKKVFSVLDLLEKVEEVFPENHFVLLGEEDFLVEYQMARPATKLVDMIKTVIVCILIFFGAAFTIMAFNNDISIEGVFEHFYYQMTGRSKPAFSELEVAYSVGLALGIVIFFNHIGNRMLTDDVTPIEVEIHKHKQDTYETIIAKSNPDE